MSDSAQRYTIQLTPLALEMLASVKDKREQEKLGDRIEQLKFEPEKQGKALYLHNPEQAPGRVTW